MSDACTKIGPAAFRRKPIDASLQNWVETHPLTENGGIPLVVQPTVPGVHLADWVCERRAYLRDLLAIHGGLLLRGFEVPAVDDFERFLITLGGPLLDYDYRSTPRTRVQGRTFTSTEYPAHQDIPLHNEQSYARTWPMLIAFLCVVAPARGGETPIADSRRVYARIPADVVSEFSGKGVTYLRTYNTGVDLTWQEVFQTRDREAVEAYCRSTGIDLEWGEGDVIRTRQTCQAVARHPNTGEWVWFNQAHLFHASRWVADGRSAPRHAQFGDGTPIDPAALDAVKRAYEAETVAFGWQRGDVMVLDNMLAAHARRPFEGPRRIVVAMAEPHE